MCLRDPRYDIHIMEAPRDSRGVEGQIRESGIEMLVRSIAHLFILIPKFSTQSPKPQVLNHKLSRKFYILSPKP